MKNEDVDMRDEYDFSQAKRGPIVPTAPNKTRIAIRIDTDILNWFREQVNAQGGGSYQALMNQALRQYIENQEGIGNRCYVASYERSYSRLKLVQNSAKMY